jgi:ATP-dependent helicase/nuclease subunit A
MIKPVSPETRRRQQLATDPRASAFVSANAGSGKTYVLTRRVIRLLLSGCDPGRILCLTFTKAAAAEMANRVFEVLAGWTRLTDAALSAEIQSLEDAAPDPRRLAMARRLFARALETPGGLKVQTIHAFAEALLQRFSVEANLAGRFEVLDDRTAALLLAEAKDRVVRETVRDPAGPLAMALGELLAVTSDMAMDKALGAMVDEREAFLAWIQTHGSLEAAIKALPGALGVAEGATAESLIAGLAAPPEFPGPVLSTLIDALDGASDTMQDLASGFRAALAAVDSATRCGLWRPLFLTQKGEPRKTPVTKAVEGALPGTCERFAREAARIIEIDRQIAALETATRTAALARLADQVIGRYQAAKAETGTLDYNDLILKAASLLSRADAAAWVQYKLDEGLDHILVDEAQDTSPKQWEIVRALAGDFFAGYGARGQTVRTFFAVGDEKQSIYSFQGAAPHLFGKTKHALRAEVTSAGAAFHDLQLNLSFRSTPDVVKAVDRVFADAAAHAGLTLEAGPTEHDTVRFGEPGLVEVWPETVADKSGEPERWEDPVDKTERGSADVQLATRIAGEIQGWLQRGERIAATGRRIRPKDVLILVRKRGAFVEAVNRALKACHVEVAGADRLDVVGHIVAQDLIAAARVALLPEDSLALAAVAKSPLVGLSEDDLFRLAHGRTGSSLWSAVLDAARSDPAAELLRAAVARWMGRADTMDPHAFFATIAGPDGARAAFRARIGREADEVIDEFLGLAHAFEDRETATLQGFVRRLAETREDVKREVDSGRDEVRVMTVHGAKGLEAPIVFLVDPGDAPATARFDPAVVNIGGVGGPLVWVQGGPKPTPVEAALGQHRQAQEEEYRRLLYVGLTRARDRLIVVGIGRDKSKTEGRWHPLVRSALLRDAEERKDEAGLTKWCWQSDRTREPHPPVDDAEERDDVRTLPDWARRAVPETADERVLTPSGAGALLSEETELSDETGRPRLSRPALEAMQQRMPAASERGRLVHKLFELLPEVPSEDRHARAAGWLARHATGLDEAQREEILASVEAVLNAPGFSALFGPGSRAEVGLAGVIRDGTGRSIPVSGQVDRLVVTEDEVLIVDFKTNAEVPNIIPEPYVVQLALYRRLLGGMAGARRVRCAILWTADTRLEEVPEAATEAVLERLLTRMG